MPTVLIIGPYRFHFYSNEGNEPPHIHVTSAERKAKFWLNSIALAKNIGFRSGELKEIEEIVHGNREKFLEAWNDFFKVGREPEAD